MRRPAVWILLFLVVGIGASSLSAESLDQRISVGVDDPNVCDTAADFPDVIVGDIPEVWRWGASGDTTAFSVATTSCNVGTCWLEWFDDDPRHPVIGQNAFRYENGRFEQIGQSWLKHGFFALGETLCSTECIGADPAHLGVNCSDPYSAPLNGLQNGLGPKSEVNPATGQFPYPYTAQGVTGGLLYKRLQLAHDDIDPGLRPDARFYVEAQYVAADDSRAGKGLNNASYRRVRVQGGSGFYGVFVEDETVQEAPAIFAWKAEDPAVAITAVDVPNDGRVYVGSRVTRTEEGRYAYEYAVQNYNSHEAIGQFIVPLSAGAKIASVGFHDVDYHSGEPQLGDDWLVQLEDDSAGGNLRWSTESSTVEANANALRWGTLYNYRFESTAPPQKGRVALRTWRTHPLQTLWAEAWAPATCNGDGVCDPGETCATCPLECGGCPTGGLELLQSVPSSTTIEPALGDSQPTAMGRQEAGAPVRPGSVNQRPSAEKARERGKNSRQESR